MLEPGKPAPGFDLPNADMESVRLADFKGRKHVVVYFYPRDGTPGCTQEAIEFSDLDDAFTRLDTVIIGINRDDCLSHAEFRDKHGITADLLSDSEGEVCRRYQVLQERQVDGVTRTSLVRSTFIVDKQGRLRHALYGVNPRGHAGEVLRLVKGVFEADGVKPVAKAAKAAGKAALNGRGVGRG